MNSSRYLLFAGAFLLLTAWMVREFLPGILWGAVFSISLWPLYCRLIERFGTRLRNPPLVFSVGFAFVFLVPLAYVGYEFAGIYSVGSNLLAKGSGAGFAPPAFLAQLPYGARLAEWWTANLGQSANLLDAANRLSDGKLTSWLSSAAVRLSGDAVAVVVMLISFHFMLKHGRYVQTHYQAILSRWFSEKSIEVVDQGISALRGTINGVILIGLLEGILLAIPLVIADIQSGLLLGLAAGVLGVVPFVMPVLMLPCVLWLYVNGETLLAVLTAIDLLVAWLVFENIVKPGIISSAVKVSPFLILLGLIGGLQMLGPVGLFLGPALIAMSTGMARDLAAAPSDAAAPPAT